MEITGAFMFFVGLITAFIFMFKDIFSSPLTELNHNKYMVMHSMTLSIMGYVVMNAQRHKTYFGPILDNYISNLDKNNKTTEKFKV